MLKWNLTSPEVGWTRRRRRTPYYLHGTAETLTLSISPQIYKSAKIEQKVIKTNKRTVIWATNIKVTVRKVIFLHLKCPWDENFIFHIFAFSCGIWPSYSCYQISILYGDWKYFFFFLAFYSRFHGRHYLALFRKLRLKLQEVTSLAQHEKFYIANFHMDSTS